jgi:protein-disulfide isomerase
MEERWKTAALGGVIGVAMSLLVVIGAIALGIIPIASDARLHAYLMAHPKLAYEMQATSEAQDAEEARLQEQAAVKRLGLKKFFDPAVAYVTGPANAKNTFVELFDYNCGHCRNTYPAVRKYYEKHKNDTRFAFIDFPIFGEASMNAARTAVAARRQGDLYLAFHFALMSEGKEAIDRDILLTNAKKSGLEVTRLSTDILDPATDKSLLAALRLAREAKFRGTPVFIVNGKVHDGEISEAEIKELTRG